MRKKARPKTLVPADPYADWRKATLDFTKSVVRECKFRLAFDDTPVWPSRQSVVDKVESWRERLLPIERRIKLEAERAGKFDWAEGELARARALVEAEAVVFTYDVLELTQKGVRPDLSLARTHRAVAIVEEIREMVGALVAAQQEPSEDEVARELVRLRERDRAVIRVLYRGGAFDLKSGQQYPQTRLAKLLGVAHNSALNARLSGLVLRAWLDNGKHHGSGSGGYFLTMKGKVAGKILSES